MFLKNNYLAKFIKHFYKYEKSLVVFLDKYLIWNFSENTSKKNTFIKNILNKNTTKRILSLTPQLLFLEVFLYFKVNNHILFLKYCRLLCINFLPYPLFINFQIIHDV